MKILRRWWVPAAAAVALTAAIGLGASVMAQTPAPGTDDGTSILDRVAQKLGISSDTLGEAIESSLNEEIDERVASGDLTQEQADAIKARIAALPDDALLGGPHGRGFGGPGRHGHFAMAVGADLAEFLGITTEELRTELQADGATLATVAAAHGKTRDELKSFLTSQIKARLDERVANGDLTQEEADERLANRTEKIDDIIDRELPGPGRFFGGREGMPFDDGEPSTEPTSTATDSSIS